MDEADGQAGDVGSVFEEPEWHHRVFGELPLVDEEQSDRDETEYDEADGRSGVPGVRDAPIFKPEEEHYRPSGYGDDADPVDGFESSYHRSLGYIDVKKEQDDDECKTVEWHFNRGQRDSSLMGQTTYD